MSLPASLSTIAVAIATAGRRDLLSETVGVMGDQTRRPDEFLLCPARPEDVDAEAVRQIFPECRIISGPIGLPHQRNAIMADTEADIVVFFDDDFLPAPDYLLEIETLFAAKPDILVATGHVIEDGILGPGLDFEHGRRLLDTAGTNSDDALQETYNAYGCNMVVRMAAVRKHAIRFDENLPLYAWLEDVDFSRQLAPYGRIVKSSRLRGVHLGTKRSGRSPGKRLGYSQIANPVYLARKGTLAWSRALRQMARNVIANTVRSLNPEPWTDRRGRLRGNLLALGELVINRIAPSRALDL